MFEWVFSKRIADRKKFQSWDMAFTTFALAVGFSPNPGQFSDIGLGKTPRFPHLSEGCAQLLQIF
ncbi:hypothetical protein SCH4B_3059 [Ruegeria sp. TrichCH4B]|nr:hypothetical protein [Tritonibacter mobilis]EEW58393.1 hypothetical protein SCH4B_3059 [Ruegeria sp. TrichCH4B]